MTCVLFKIAEKEQNYFVKYLSGKHADEHMYLTSSTTPHLLCQYGILWVWHLLWTYCNVASNFGAGIAMQVLVVCVDRINAMWNFSSKFDRDSTTFSLFTSNLILACHMLQSGQLHDGQKYIHWLVPHTCTPSVAVTHHHAQRHSLKGVLFRWSKFTPFAQFSDLSFLHIY